MRRATFTLPYRVAVRSVSHGGARIDHWRPPLRKEGRGGGRLYREIHMTAKRAALYLRVSTREQSTAMQRAALEEVAARAGWHIVGVYEDAGISGAKGRDQRPEFDRLLRTQLGVGLML
jgi:Resolvase, N terminal domain